MFAVCGRSLLLLHLLLQGVPGVGREGTGEGKDHENMLSLPGDCLHHTSHRHSLLYQYLVWLQELLLLDAMPSKLRRVKSLLMQQFRVYWAFNGLQNFSQLSCPLRNNADPHALPQSHLDDHQLRPFLRQIYPRTWSLHWLSVCQHGSIQPIRRGKQVRLYHLYAHPGTYVVIKSIILIDLFYLAGIKLVKRYDAGETSYGALLIILTLICEAVAVGLNIYGYTLFSAADSCGNTLWVNIVTSILLVVLPVFQCFNFNKQNSLLTTSLVSLYISYLALICQFSYGEQCNSFLTKAQAEWQ